MPLWSDLCFKVITFEDPNEIAQTLLSNMAGYSRLMAMMWDASMWRVQEQQHLQHTTD